MDSQYQQWQQPQPTNSFIHSPQPQRMQSNSYDPYNQSQQPQQQQYQQQQYQHSSPQQQYMNNGYTPIPNQNTSPIPKSQSFGGNQGFNQNQGNTGFLHGQGPSTFQQQFSNQHFGQSFNSDQQKPFQPIFGADFMNDPKAQLGLQLGQKAFESGAEIVNQNLNRWFNPQTIRAYFDVSNSFVFKKLCLIFFPFRHKSWARIGKRNEQTGKMEYNPPRDDINSPDLYIPIMSCITYILLFAITMTSEGKFNPELLGKSSLKVLSFLTGEVLLMKLICYLMSISADVSILDLIAYAGYKFSGVIVVSILNHVSTKLITYLIYGYISIALGFFMLRSMKYFVLTDQSMSANSQRKNKIHFLFVNALMEIIISWFLII